MRESLLELLACTECDASLVISNAETIQREHLIQGVLSCTGCESETQVERGVPRFAKDIDADKEKTAENFGWQWNEFTQEDERYQEQFLGWLRPVEPGFFKGKTILEGGCGKGRHTTLANRWGAKEVVGVDLSSAVDSAFDATLESPGVHVVQADIFKLPFKKVFDYAFSVGVLHHTPNPKGAFVSLAGKVRAGGHISAWVYGAENNEWITSLVNPVRERITSKLNQPTLYQFSRLPTLSVFAASKLFYRPLNKFAPRVAEKIFYNTYMNQLASFGWREQHNIVFDHLVAPTAFYISKEEFEGWWDEVKATDPTITWHNKNSWSGFGQLP